MQEYDFPHFQPLELLEIVRRISDNKGETYKNLGEGTEELFKVSMRILQRWLKAHYYSILGQNQ